jgi:hypothetical protein
LALSGSDYHRTDDLATGGILLPRRVRTMAQLVENLKILGTDNLIIPDLVPAKEV